MIQTTSKSGIVAFVNECVKAGMHHVVCSPGSRNAPLVIAFDAHPEVETFVIHDERSAAFYAMGMAQALNAPVGVTCTSGSAMLNYYPAVAEAYYQCIPLVVISADRPEEWVDHGDGQTIVQKGVYQNHIRFETTINEDLKDETELKTSVQKAFSLGKGNWKGPIHFNVPLSEPLYQTVSVEYTPGPVEVKNEVQDQLSAEDLKMVQQLWSSDSKKLILCGQHIKDSALQLALIELANNPSVAILVENTSNLVHPKFVHCIDRTLQTINKTELVDFQPDVLITIGGAVVSKRIKKFLRNSDIKVHWKIGYDFPQMDTYRALTNTFQVKSTYFVQQLLEVNGSLTDCTFGSKWKQRDFIAQERLVDFIDTLPYSDLRAFETVLDYIPENASLHMGNSSVVRYCQLFDPISSIHYFSNRGTSGIDGCTSTACGVALMSPDKCNVLITGDVSFFYDSNALWSNHLPSNLRIIIINNGGGGIFKIIEGPASTEQLEKYFEAKHTFSAEYLCKTFGVEYTKAESVEAIENEMEQFFHFSVASRPKLLEIFTPSEVNHRVLQKFFDRLTNS